MAKVRKEKVKTRERAGVYHRSGRRKAKAKEKVKEDSKERDMDHSGKTPKETQS